MQTLQSLRLILRSTSTRFYYNSRNVIHLRSQRRCCSSHDTREPTINPSSSAPNPPHDHHALGKRLNLFSTSPYSAGSPLLHADGSHVFLKLQSLLRAQHQAFGFREVISPIIYKQSLWEKSGHWQNYSDDMFEVVGRGARAEEEGIPQAEDEKWGLKPMNCPGHCLLFATESRSYRDLPVRFADFSPLHRNEISGALSGLTRVRRFHQDDGHIFCRPDQVKQEIASTLQMVNLIYSAFGLRPHKLLLSTRPEEAFIGTEAEWTKAEAQLQSALEESTLDWSLNPGDGAFYGPKIDIVLHDNHGKEHQTATIQLDFQLPQRFNLQYQTDNPNVDRQSQSAVSGSTETPILIHRAVLGSLERFMALLIEHYGGKWPFWLNPRQVCILTLNDTEPVLAHAREISSILSGIPQQSIHHQQEEEEGEEKEGITKPVLQSLLQPQYTVDTDSSPETLSKKILHARNKGYGILCLVGKQEAERGDVAVNILCASESDSEHRSDSGHKSDSEHMSDSEHHSGSTQRVARLEAVVESVLPAATKTGDWRKKRKLVCSAEDLRKLMGLLCEDWL